MRESRDIEFLKLVEENLGIAHKVARSYFQDPAERNDAIQEMMYQLWKSFPGFNKTSKFSTWMYSVCMNTVLTYWKKFKKEQRDKLDPAHEEIPEPAKDDQEAAVESLYRAIAHLSPVNKAIALLYLDNLSYEEIADIMGLTKSNVSVRLVRIKKELEIQLKKTT